ncbi:uncharacterized protein LOC127794959 isoform X2 [Diospyros lotus]|uniref:uncharacterized protein LOC127794959 isoform X2 n=1 Tax=Diospyros lotus TaxID=55363 RepID=UPI002251C548|nr:uncharacterized protein LOC127794959 isoform X2 [Diospyros lotus]
MLVVSSGFPRSKGCQGQCAAAIDARNESESSMENLGVKPRGESNKGSGHRYSDSDSPSNSPTSCMVGSTGSGSNFRGSSGGSSSSSSGWSCSGSITGEDEERDDGCLDDWEAVADALAADDDKEEEEKSPPGREIMTPVTHGPGSGIGIPKTDDVVKVQRAPPTCRAWKPDDAFRPQSLPNLSKQLSFPMNSGRRYGGAWGCNSAISAPSACPICCEDFDFTDSNFLPCSCGFRVCLFCHKRILEEDGRCPGCRKQYDHGMAEGEATLDGGNMAFRLARSFSMITRS